MNEPAMWFYNLLHDSTSVAQSVFIVSVAAALGLGLGNIKVRGVGLGIAGCLFTGLLFGHFGFNIGHEILEFLREFGLILFVYTVGIQVGPGFFSALKAQGLKLNLLAGSVVVFGAVIVYLMGRWGGVPVSAAVGIFSGATTNTPSLGAAQSLLGDLLGKESAAVAQAGLAYAVAYPFGVIGIILTMLALRGVFQLNPDKEAEAYGADRRVFHEPLETVNIEVINHNLEGLRIDDIPGIADLGVVISRVKKKSGGVAIGSGRLTLNEGDIVHAVGSSRALKKLEIICGRRTETDVKAIDNTFVSRRIVITKTKMAGRHLDDLVCVKRGGAVCTRINRAGVQFTPTSNVHLQFGDVITLVATDPVLRDAEAELGNSVQELAHPHIIPIFIGIGLGVLLGAIPFQIPGMPVAMKLGLAGGPLLVAILFSNIRHLGPIVWHLPHSSNMVLREIGIVLFLTCVGLKSGGSFVEILASGPGFEWMAWGVLVTLVPLLLVSIFARVALKMNFLVICGLMAGASTDPPALAFANTQAASDAPSLTYSTVYPLTMILRVFLAQALAMLLA